MSDGLLGGRPVAASADDGDALVVEDREGLFGEDALDRGRQPGDVVASQRGERRDRGGVARRVAVGLLDLRRDDQHLVGGLGERALLLAGDEPARAGEGPHGLERERRAALVADDDEQVGFGRREHRLERLQRLAARLGGVEGRPAAREDDAPVRQPPVADALGHAA